MQAYAILIILRPLAYVLNHDWLVVHIFLVRIKALKSEGKVI